MKLTVHYLDDEIDSIPIAETDREVRTEGGVEQYRYVLRSEWRPVPGRQEASESEPQRRVCPDHGVPDCSPLLNGCSRLTGQGSEHG